LIDDKGSHIVGLNRSAVDDPVYIDTIYILLARAEEHVVWELILIQWKSDIQPLDVPRVRDRYLDLLTGDAGGYVSTGNRNDDGVPDDVSRFVCVGVVQVGHILSGTCCRREQNREDDTEADDPRERYSFHHTVTDRSIGSPVIRESFDRTVTNLRSDIRDSCLEKVLRRWSFPLRTRYGDVLEAHVREHVADHCLPFLGYA